MFGVEARIPSEILVGLPEMERTAAAYAFQRYQKLSVAYEAARAATYTETKRAKYYYDIGAIQKQFQGGDNVRIRIAQLNRTPMKLHSKWAKLNRIVAVKGVVASVEDPETEDSFTVHVDRLAYSSPRLRDELVLEPFVPFDVPFRSLSNPSLHDLFCESPLDQPTLPMPTPTPIDEPPPTPGSLDFREQTRAQGNRNVRRNLDPD